VTALISPPRRSARSRIATSSTTTLVDDVVLGCVDPVGEAGGDIARAAALTAGYGNTVAGVQINRFCASGLDAINFASAQVMSGQHDMTIGGGVESMSRVGMGASGWRMADGPRDRDPDLFPAAGHFRRRDRDEYGFSRDDVDCLRASRARSAPRRRGRGQLQRTP